MENQLISIKDYGGIQITLKKIMDERDITRNYLARAINARFEVIDKWYNGDIEKIDTDVLARICYVLKIQPGDIISYDPDCYSAT
jgi:putative transcriptional regulator